MLIAIRNKFVNETEITTFPLLLVQQKEKCFSSVLPADMFSVVHLARYLRHSVLRKNVRKLNERLFFNQFSTACAEKKTESVFPKIENYQ